MLLKTLGQGTCGTLTIGLNSPRVGRALWARQKTSGNHKGWSCPKAVELRNYLVVLFLISSVLGLICHPIWYNRISFDLIIQSYSYSVKFSHIQSYLVIFSCVESYSVIVTFSHTQSYSVISNRIWSNSVIFSHHLS